MDAVLLTLILLLYYFYMSYYSSCSMTLGITRCQLGDGPCTHVSCCSDVSLLLNQLTSNCAFVGGIFQVNLDCSRRVGLMVLVTTLATKPLMNGPFPPINGMPSS